MLILTRRIGETIVIGDNVEVTVLDLSGNKAKIGIAAPDDVKIFREEVLQRINKEKEKENETNQ